MGFSALDLTLGILSLPIPSLDTKSSNLSHRLIGWALQPSTLIMGSPASDAKAEILSDGV